MGRDIRSPEVLSAMQTVPREKFISAGMEKTAYDDNPLAIGYGQTISQPYIVALMAQKLVLKKTDKTLEVGTGSGYQAAILSKLVDHVYTTEIIKELATESSERLAWLGYSNVTIIHTDGSLGLERYAPFDKIIAAAAARTPPKALEDQLKEGGLIILPQGGSHFQELVLGKKTGGVIEYKTVTSVRFVPMTGAAEDLP
jgi:protein-L-isoaspartate(D-aspartate) O-methyltransferase